MSEAEIEAVARALYIEDGDRPDYPAEQTLWEAWEAQWPRDTEWLRELFRRRARAAIAALDKLRAEKEG